MNAATLTLSLEKVCQEHDTWDYYISSVQMTKKFPLSQTKFTKNGLAFEPYICSSQNYMGGGKLTLPIRREGSADSYMYCVVRTFDPAYKSCQLFRGWGEKMHLLRERCRIKKEIKVSRCRCQDRANLGSVPFWWIDGRSGTHQDPRSNFCRPTPNSQAIPKAICVLTYMFFFILFSLLASVKKSWTLPISNGVFSVAFTSKGLLGHFFLILGCVTSPVSEFLLLLFPSLIFRRASTMGSVCFPTILDR